jgi:sec-independent protein translocase protein TatA
MGTFGIQELLVVLAIILLLFGAKKVPELFRAMGQGISEFKRGMKEGEQPPTTQESPSESSESK